MNRIALFFLIFVCSATFAEEPVPSDQARSVFSYSKEMGVSAQLRAVQDLIILKDGTLLQGQVDNLPALKFSFGKVSLSPNDLELIAFTNDGGAKVKAKTKAGEYYIGVPENWHLSFKENRWEASSTSIDLRNVDSVLFKSRGTLFAGMDRPRLHLYLRDGSVFPIEFADREIKVTDGQTTRRVGREQVVDISFNGGIFGDILDKDGTLEPLSLSYTETPNVRFITPDGHGHIQYAWEQIEQISIPDRIAIKVGLDPMNGGENVPEQMFASAHSSDRVHEVEFIETPLKQFADSGEWVIPEIEFMDTPVPLFADSQDIDIPTIEFITTPPRFFSDEESFPLPEVITFIEEPPLRLDPSSMQQIEEMFAVGEDFDFEDDAVPTVETEEDEVQFVSCDRDSSGICLAVGEVFDLDDLEESTEEDAFEDEVEFLALQESPLLALGEDFDFGDEEETSDESDEVEAIEFISRGYTRKNLIQLEQAFEDEMLALGECVPCCKQAKSHPMPHAEFSMDDPSMPEVDEEEVKIEFPIIEVPDRPEEPQKYPMREGPSVRVNVSKVRTSPSFPYSEDPKTAPREYDGLIYVKAGRSDGLGFYIKPRKVTNLEYKKFVDAINYRIPIHWVGGAIPPGMEDDPVVNVSYRDAFLYSVWAGKRLPSEEELVRSVETNMILTDPNNQSAEWTSTPTLRSVKYTQSGIAAKIGQSFSPSHQVFSRYRIVSLNNDDSNNYTGFRTAIDAH